MTSTKATRKYPSLPGVGGTLDAHGVLLSAIREAIEIHERRTKDYLSSFVRLNELVDLDVLKISGATIDRGSAFAAGGGSSAWADLTGVPANISVLAALADPGADRLLFWDDSAGALAYLTLGTNLSITGTTINAASSGGNSLETEIMADTPMAYWKCTVGSGTTLVDSSGNGHDLTLAGTYNLQYSSLMHRETSRFIRFQTGANRGSRTGTLGFTPPLSGNWTVEAVICPLTFSTENRMISIGGVGETEATNYQFIFYLVAGVPTVFWEFGAGTNQSLSTGILLQVAKAYHLAARKDGTANTVEFYINGWKVFSTSYASEPTGGTDASQRASIGYDGTSNTGDMIIGHVAVFGSLLTEARISAHAAAAGLT